LKNDELGRLLGALRHCKERPHLERLHLPGVENLDLQTEFAGELLRLIGEIGGGTDVGRQVAEVAGEIHAVGKRLRARHGLRSGGLLGAGHGENHLSGPSRCGLLAAFHRFETIGGFAAGHDLRVQLPFERALGDRRLVEQRYDLVGRCVPECPPDRGHRIGVAFFRDLGAAAHRHEEHPLQCAFEVKHDRGARLFLQIPSGDDCGKPPALRLIDGAGIARQGFADHDRHDCTTGFQTVGGQGLCAKLH